MKRLPLLISLTISSFCMQISVAQKAVEPYIFDMVHNNPGEPLTKSAFNNSTFLAANGYNGKVMNDFIFPHAAIKFKKLNATIFPDGSKEALWVEAAAKRIKANIKEAHAAGIKMYYFTDIIVLPKKLVELYRSEICDANGKISFERPKTIEIHKLMLEELFEEFPELDGLVIRTGETYTNNVPYHTGNNPITNEAKSHIKLLNLLREEVCVKLNKQIFYRTWSFGGMHDDTAYYLNVTNQIETHPNLVFSIKHTKGDYHRTYDFNPTLGLGKHKQIVEVQCQREYEGKGAYPNYIMDGVINGFEEFSKNKPQKGNKCLNDLKYNKNFAGVWSWSRGGGWVGPYISNEFWPKLNAYVISQWAKNMQQSEATIFNRFMKDNGVAEKSKAAFRELALLSSNAVIRGHSSVKLPFDSNMVFWMRDEFLGGIEPNAETGARHPSEGFLYTHFKNLYQTNMLDTAIAEKYESVNLWKKIVQLSNQIQLKNKEDELYIKISSQYGLLLHQIIAEGWNIMAMGFSGDQSGKYNYNAINGSIKKYDAFWKRFELFKTNNPSSATLYQPFAFVYQGPLYHLEKGMHYSVNKYRKIINNYSNTKQVSISNY